MIARLSNLTGLDTGSLAVHGSQCVPLIPLARSTISRPSPQPLTSLFHPRNATFSRTLAAIRRLLSVTAVIPSRHINSGTNGDKRPQVDLSSPFERDRYSILTMCPLRFRSCRDRYLHRQLFRTHPIALLRRGFSATLVSPLALAHHQSR